MTMSAAANIQPLKYLGEYEHGLDEKRRMQVPAKWRPPGDCSQFELVLIRWQPPGQPVPCLLALPPEAFQKLSDKVSALPFADTQAETVRRSLTRWSEPVTLDASGRICLPQRLADAGGIQRRAILIGMLDRFQIWSPEHYEVIRQQDEAGSAEAMKLI